MIFLIDNVSTVIFLGPCVFIVDNPFESYHRLNVTSSNIFSEAFGISALTIFEK